MRPRAHRAIDWNTDRIWTDHIFGDEALNGHARSRTLKGKWRHSCAPGKTGGSTITSLSHRRLGDGMAGDELTVELRERRVEGKGTTPNFKRDHY